MTYPDKTVEELRDDPDYDLEEQFKTTDEMQDHIDDLHTLFEIQATAIVLSRMVDDSHITVQEYMHLLDYLEEEDRSLDATVV